MAITKQKLAEEWLVKFSCVSAMFVEFYFRLNNVLNYIVNQRLSQNKVNKTCEMVIPRYKREITQLNTVKNSAVIHLPEDLARSRDILRFAAPGK